MVDVPGHGRRHLWLRGSSDRPGPVVVVVACLGGSVLGWAGIADQLEKHVQVLLYDRAGLGWSDAPRRWSTSIIAMVEELETVLAASQRPGPYLLVGHSIGGVVARQYA
jgi:pimeloyl-ACP methyl ester carboxylesterase